jgi:hypothetical protein
MVESKSVWGLLGILNDNCLANFDESTGKVKVLLNLSATFPVSKIYSMASIGSYCVVLQFVDRYGSSQLARYCVGYTNATVIFTGNSVATKIFYDDMLGGLISIYSNAFNNGYSVDYYDLKSGTVNEAVSFTSGQKSFGAFSYSIKQSETVGFGYLAQQSYYAQGYSVLTGVNMMASQLWAGSQTYQFLDSASYDKNGTFVGVALYNSNTPGIYVLIGTSQTFAMSLIMSTDVPNTKGTFFSGSLIDFSAKYYIVFRNIAGYTLYIYNVDSAKVTMFNLGTFNGLRNIVAVTY